MDSLDPSQGCDPGLTSLVYPTYNPGATLERTWQQTREFLRAVPGAWEVHFVCDGCTDGSSEQLLRWKASEPAPIFVHHYSPNRGKGYAVRYGLQVARGQWRIFTDVDLAYSFDDVLRIAQVLRNGGAVAIASRQHPQSEVILPPALMGYAWRRQLQSTLFSWIARRLLPIPFRDTQAGLKGMTATVAQRVLPLLQCDGFGFDCELLTACIRLQIPVEEIPVRVRLDSTASTTSARTSRRMLAELWKIRSRWNRERIEVPLSSDSSSSGRRAA